MTSVLGRMLYRARYLFDWTPVAVSAPTPKYYEYHDMGQLFLGYAVSVQYRHHRPREYLFPCDEEKLGLVSRKYAMRRARRFYQQMKTEAKGL